MAISCPFCGSREYSTKEVEHSIPIPYGSDAKFIKIIYTCAKCEEEGDFTGENDSVILNALLAANHKAAENIISTLNGSGISTPYIERALRLQIGSIEEKLRNRYTERMATEQLILLRIIRTYPWILEVADENFNSEVAKTVLMREAAKLEK